jgi:hypothetical protein
MTKRMLIVVHDALRGLRHAREALLQPWSTDVTPPKARVSGASVLTGGDIVRALPGCAATPLYVQRTSCCFVVVNEKRMLMV